MSSEKVYCKRVRRILHTLEKKRRPAALYNAVCDFGYFKHGVNLGSDAFELAGCVELVKIVLQISKCHSSFHCVHYEVIVRQGLLANSPCKTTYQPRGPPAG